MKRLYGNIVGLKANQLRRLENLYRRRIPADYVITPEIAREISLLADELRRQVGLLINRKGKIAYVIVGDHQKIVIPNTGLYRTAPGRLKGLRCVHTHLTPEPLTQDDVTDLALLRLDMMAAVAPSPDGHTHEVHLGHILPQGSNGKYYQIEKPLRLDQLGNGCTDQIRALEDELARVRAIHAAGANKERALIVSVTTASKRNALDSLAELRDLARSGGIEIAGEELQQRRRIDSRFLIGLGKLQDLTLKALTRDINLLIFDQELNPSQIRSITDQIDLKVIDRTQLILDIFAQRAQTREGKLQVELAQLKYLLPRLITKNTAMSRLTGGIGGRGPGETKLEINRRRVRDRITRLEKDLAVVRKQRKQQRAQRSKKGVPVISIIGYTNAGKSTLLNTLTQSKVLAENQLFATLDPSSRRLRFPQDIEVIITDTVGFIKNLPKDLMVAFRATLEELESADLLLHVVDLSNQRIDEQIQSVNKILRDLRLNHIPQLMVLNKKDRVTAETITRYERRLKGFAVSAKDKTTLVPLIDAMQSGIAPLKSSQETGLQVG